MRALSCLLAIAALAGGCRKSFDPATWVVGLRVLAVKAAPPELAADETATLTVLAVDTEGRPIDVTWDACLLPTPASGSTFDLECLTSDAGSAYRPLGGGLSVAYTMAAHPIDELGLPDSTAGFYVPVRLIATAGDAAVPAIYRVRYSLGLVPPNQNPAIAGVFLVPADAPDPVPAEQLVPLEEATPAEVLVGDRVKLRATLVAGSAETYLVPDGDPLAGETREVVELVRISWYSTAGDVRTEVTGEDKPDTEIRFDKYLPTTAPAGTPVDLWIVARDERGGTDWVHRSLLLK
jgi:hypothetical protein